jgi:hypothetical protein
MDAKTSMHGPIVVLEFGGFKSKTTHVLAEKKKLKIPKMLEKRKIYGNQHKNSQNLFNQHKS